MRSVYLFWFSLVGSSIVFFACSEQTNSADFINATKTCLSHVECVPGQFCAWSNCLDRQGRNYACGLCKLCQFCACDSDSIDLACPQQCPSQPSEGVRYLQGIFADQTPIPTFENYNCTSRLVISGISILFLQMAVHSQHPASIQVVNISAAADTACPRMSLSGIIESSVPSPSDAAVLELDVSVTSEGPRRSRRNAQPRPIHARLLLAPHSPRHVARPS